MGCIDAMVTTNSIALLSDYAVCAHATFTSIDTIQ